MSHCFYCGARVLKGQSEQDHFPVPASYGGTQTVTACIECHDLKDRTAWRDLPLDFKATFLEQFEQMPREAKIVFAQFMRVSFESLNLVQEMKQLAQSRPKLPAPELRTGDVLDFGDRGPMSVAGVSKLGGRNWYLLEPYGDDLEAEACSNPPAAPSPPPTPAAPSRPRPLRHPWWMRSNREERY